MKKYKVKVLCTQIIEVVAKNKKEAIETACEDANPYFGFNSIEGGKIISWKEVKDEEIE